MRSSTPLEQRITLHQQVQNLQKEGYKRGEILKKLNLSESLYSTWVYHGHKPYGCLEIKPTAELAWLIGAVLGDGNKCSCVVKGWQGRKYPHYEVRLKSVDYEFVYRFAEYMAKIAERKNPYAISLKQGKYYTTSCQISSVFHFFNQPIEKLKPFIEAYPADFIRGFADSEGSCVVSEKGKYPEISIKIRNQLLSILEYIGALLKRLGVKHTIGIDAKQGDPAKDNTVKNKNVYALRITKQSAIIKYGEQIGFTIRRKVAKINRALKILKSLRYYCSSCQMVTKQFHCPKCGRLGRLLPWRQS